MYATTYLYKKDLQNDATGIYWEDIQTREVKYITNSLIIPARLSQDGIWGVLFMYHSNIMCRLEPSLINKNHW